jgi:hypothetical protein
VLVTRDKYEAQLRSFYAELISRCTDPELKLVEALFEVLIAAHVKDEAPEAHVMDALAEFSKQTWHRRQA